MSTINADVDGIILTADSSATLSLATGDVVRATIDSSGNVGIGTASPYTPLDVNGFFSAGVRNTTSFSTVQTHYLGCSPSDLTRNNIVGNINGDSATPVRLRFYKSRGTAASPTAVNSSDLTGDIQTWAYDGTGYIQATGITSSVTATPSINSISSQLSFSTNGGSSAPTARMVIDSSGNVGIGGTADASSKVFVTGTLPSSSNLSIAFRQGGTIPSATTSAYIGFFSFPTTEAASFTLGVASGFTAAAQAFGAGSTVTTQIGFEAASTLTGATNNYGFFSNIASGSGRWNFFANGSADNYFAGRVGIGGTASAFAKVHVLGTLPTSSNITVANYNSGIIPSGATSAAFGYYSALGTQAASFTLFGLYHNYVNPQAFGAGSTVSNQYGYYAESTLTGATTNYGFFSNIAAGSNRWNFYAAGTAANYFAGITGIGISPATYVNYRVSIQSETGNYALLLINDTAIQTTQANWNQATSGDNKFIEFYTEAGPVSRGSIDFNRAGGLVRYNTTSDYRAKTITGLVTNSGELLDALKVYNGKMKDATVERPMLIAHEAQEVAPYAVSGEKDAVDKDGKPIYQQIDVSSLVPLLIAEIQSLRQRVAELEAK